MTDNTDLGPTAAIVTIGDEIVEGRVLNENATWLSDELMARGARWPTRQDRVALTHLEEATRAT